MATAGLVRKTEDDHDKRFCYLSLTEKGMHTVRAVQEEIMQKLSVFFGRLTEEERQELLACLERIAVLINKASLQ